MSSPAVIALRCTVDTKVERIDRGEILYAKYGSKGELPELSRNGGDGTAVVTAEAVTLYKGQEGMPVSVPIVVLGKTEVIVNGKHQKLKLEADGQGMPGTPLFFAWNSSKNITEITDKNKGRDRFLGTVVHQAFPTTYSVDLVVNFAK